MLTLYSLGCVRALVSGWLYIWANCWLEKVCGKNRVGRRKEIQEESRGFEDEGLRARKEKGRENENPKEKDHCYESLAVTSR